MDDSIQNQRIEFAEQILQLGLSQIIAELRFFSEAASILNFKPVLKGAVLSTDGTALYYEPHKILALFVHEPNRVTRAMLHTYLHCILCHPFQRQEKDPKWWDLACDMAVEKIISELAVPTFSVNAEKAIDAACTKWMDLAEGTTSEKLYNYFLKYPPDDKEYSQLNAMLARDDHHLWYRNGRPSSSKSKEAITLRLDSGKTAQDDFEDDGISVELQQEVLDVMSADPASKWRRMARKVSADLENFDKKWGQQAGHMRANLKPIVFEQVDYQEFLRRFGSQSEVLQLSDEEFDLIAYTYGLSHYGNIPFVEPLETQTDQRIREFVIVVDTSGSVQGELVQTFLQRTYNVLRQSRTFATQVKIYLLQCDSVVQSVQEISDLHELENVVLKMDDRGGGGTDFRPAFEFVDKLIEERKLQKVDGLLYFTDGVGKYPKQQPPYKTAFIFHRDDYISPHVPHWAIRAVLTTDNIKLMKES